MSVVPTTRGGTSRFGATYLRSISCGASPELLEVRHNDGTCGAVSRNWFDFSISRRCAAVIEASTSGRLGLVGDRRGHRERAELLRRVLGTFRPEDDTSTDRALRRRVEGAVIAEELAAGDPVPRMSDPAEPTPTG